VTDDEVWEANGFVLAHRIPCIWDMPIEELTALIKTIGEGNTLRLRVDDQTGEAWMYFRRRQ
jgi:hypothetical protein